MGKVKPDGNGDEDIPDILSCANYHRQRLLYNMRQGKSLFEISAALPVIFFSKL